MFAVRGARLAASGQAMGTGTAALRSARASPLGPGMHGALLLSQLWAQASCAPTEATAVGDEPQRYDDLRLMGFDAGVGREARRYEGLRLGVAADLEPRE